MKPANARYQMQRMIRLALLALAILLALGGPFPGVLARLFPSLSPLTLLSEWIAQRRPAVAALWAIPPLVLLALACTRGRFFCRWICPVGTALYLTSPSRLHTRVLRVRVNGMLFWVIMASSLAGLPVLLFLEPQPMLHRSLVWLSGGLSAVAWIPGVLFPLCILLGLIQPMVWCSHICPTGYLFDLVHGLSQDIPRTVNRERRNLLTGLFVGLPLAALAAHLPKNVGPAPIPLLPPGARPAPEFGGVCHRCCAWVGAGTTGILRVDWRPGRPLIEWFQPEMDPAYGACEVDCHACGQVCPSGAIRSLTLHQKQHCRIGLAEVQKASCLGWAAHQYCLLCMKACPYGAIETTALTDGTPCPVVRAALCRGCGACQQVCPVQAGGAAIQVRALPAAD